MDLSLFVHLQRYYLQKQMTMYRINVLGRLYIYHITSSCYYVKYISYMCIYIYLYIYTLFKYVSKRLLELLYFLCFVLLTVVVVNYNVKVCCLKTTLFVLFARETLQIILGG